MVGIPPPREAVRSNRRALPDRQRGEARLLFTEPTYRKKRKHHVLIGDFTRTTTRDAAPGSRAVSARVVAALHFRAALSQDAGTRASGASDVLRGADQAKLPGLARP